MHQPGDPRPGGVAEVVPQAANEQGEELPRGAAVRADQFFAGGQDRDHVGAHHRAKQRVLRVEVAVERALADARASRDVIELGACEARRREYVRGGRDDFFMAGFGTALPAGARGATTGLGHGGPARE
jgi:hypothetical protein